MKTNCITFDKQAQDSLPEDIKRQMKADRDKAQKGKSNDIKIMATIEKAYDLAEDRATGSPVNAYMNGFEDGYKDGLSEAFRWRDASKELPEQYREVLLKSGDFVYVGYRIIEAQEGFFYWVDGRDDEITDVTHWRPINMEDMG